MGCMKRPILTLALLLSQLTFSLPQAWSAADNVLSCPAIPKVMNFYFFHHVQENRMTQIIRDLAVENYIKRLDPSKSFLLKPDVKDLSSRLVKLFETSITGDCQAAIDSQTLLVKRAQEAEAYVRKFVTDPKYKLDENAQVVTDPEKREYPKDEAERNKNLEGHIHFQISNYLETGVKLEEAKKKLVHRYELIVRRTQEQKKGDIFANFIDSFAFALDPHSSYFSPDDLENFQIQVGLSLEGIGVSLSMQDGYATVEEIIPGGAADRVKSLQPKDKIIAVAQDKGDPIDVIDWDLNEVVKLIRGKKNSKVTLTVMRQAGDKVDRFTTTIIRDQIDLKEQAAKLTVHDVKQDKHTFKVGVIDLPSFYGDKDPTKRTSYRDMKKLIADAKSKKVDGLILDLSRNGGGLLDEAVFISGLFVKQGGIVATKLGNSDIEVLEDRDPAVQYNGPLVVLTSRLSASASEIVAGAMKDYKRAVIVGADHTFGKGSVQTVVPLAPGLGALKVTNGLFFRPGGSSTQHAGVDSDIILPSIYTRDEFGEKSLKNSLPQKRVTSFLSEVAQGTSDKDKWSPVTETVVETLRKKSAARIKDNTQFKEIETELDKIKKDKGIIKLAELKKEKKSDKDPDDPITQRKEREKPTPQLVEALSIMADYVSLNQSTNAVAKK